MMKNQKFRMLFTGLFILFLLSPAWAGAESFRLAVDSTLNGKELKPGRYEIRMEGTNEVTLLRNGKVVVTAAIEREPLGNKQPNSVARSKEELTEIRLKDEILVFVDVKAEAR